MRHRVLRRRLEFFPKKILAAIAEDGNKNNVLNASQRAGWLMWHCCAGTVCVLAADRTLAKLIIHIEKIFPKPNQRLGIDSGLGYFRNPIPWRRYLSGCYGGFSPLRYSLTFPLGGLGKPCSEGVPRSVLARPTMRN